MLVTAAKVMFLEGFAGEFEGRDGNKVEYQTGEFFQPDGGGSVRFSIDKEIPLSEFQSAHFYDLTLDISQSDYTLRDGSTRKAFRAKVVDALALS